MANDAHIGARAIQIGIGASDPNGLSTWKILARSVSEWMAECQPRWLMETRVEAESITFVIGQIKQVSTLGKVNTGRKRVFQFIAHLKQLAKRKHPKDTWKAKTSLGLEVLGK